MTLLLLHLLLQNYSTALYDMLFAESKTSRLSQTITVVLIPQLSHFCNKVSLSPPHYLLAPSHILTNSSSIPITNYSLHFLPACDSIDLHLRHPNFSRRSERSWDRSDTFKRETSSLSGKSYNLRSIPTDEDYNLHNMSFKCKLNQ